MTFAEQIWNAQCNANPLDRVKSIFFDVERDSEELSKMFEKPKPWYQGREVVWKYTFRPIYSRFVVEKCVKDPKRMHRLLAVKHHCSYEDCSAYEGRVRNNSLWLNERDDEKGAELLRTYYKERATNPKEKDIAKYLDRIAYISKERAIVYAD